MPISTVNEDLRYEQSLFWLAIVFLAWLAVMFTTPVGEGDFYWHVKTGEWIWQHQTLPNADPFSFTVKDVNPLAPDSKRIPFLLKQYWLGQLFFYGIWQLAGEAGMVVFRSLCYTGILCFLFGWSRKLSSGLVPLLAVVAAGSVLRNYSNERPQLFAFILMPLLLLVLERLRTCRSPREALLPLLALPLIMLVWSNCHGSFILGIVVIALYAAGHGIDALRKREQLNFRSLCSMLLAITATLANPNGYGAFVEFFALPKGYINQVAEFKSPLLLAYKFHAIDYGYWLLLIVALLLAAVSLRRMAVSHLLVITSLAGLSLTGTRYIPFFVLAVPLICSYAPKWPAKRAAAFLGAAVIVLLMATADYRNILKFRAERAFPVKAAEFLRTADPGGNMFNYIGWGGYLMCYSRYPVFIDGRTLIIDLLPAHGSVLAGRNWQAILDRYDINFMIIPGTDAISLQAYPLLLQLLGDSGWSLIYQDEVAVVLLRNSAENSALIARYAMDKGLLTSHVQARWQWQTINNF